MFRGHEDDVFKGAQPNLFCNHFYWMDEPETRWPDKIAQCAPADAPYMLCSDSFYCNWTNNPQLWSIAWWRKEWIDGTLKKPNSISPYADVEYWCARRATRCLSLPRASPSRAARRRTNWDYDAWNNKKWTVAQGEGLFKHVDRGNFG